MYADFGKGGKPPESGVFFSPVDHAERLCEETRRVTGVFAPLPFERASTRC